MFKLKTGMPAQAIPYKSSNEMMLSVAARQTLFAICRRPSRRCRWCRAARSARSPSTGRERSSELPDVPSMAEVGLADVDIRPQWSGAFLIAGTPPAIARSSKRSCAGC